MLGRESGHGRRSAAGSALLAVLAGLAVATAGCSSGGSGAAADGTPAASASPASATSATAPLDPSTTASAASRNSTASTASPAPAPPPASTTAAPSPSKPPAQPTGTYLKTLLPTAGTDNLLVLATTFVPGWTADPRTESDSGGTATAPAAPLVKDDCSHLIARKLDLATAFNTATASESLASGTTPVGVALYAYKPGDAAKSLAQLRQNLTSTCDGFSAMQYSIRVPVDVAATPVPGLGDEALLVKITPKGAYIDQENLLVRRGDLTVSLWADNAYGDLPDLVPAAKGLVTELG